MIRSKKAEHPYRALCLLWFYAVVVVLLPQRSTSSEEKTYPNPFSYKIGFGYALFGGSGCGALNFRRACNALEHSDRGPCSASPVSSAGRGSAAQQYRTRTGAASAMPVQNKNPGPAASGFCFGGRYRTRTCDLLHVKQMLYQLS